MKIDKLLLSSLILITATQNIITMDTENIPLEECSIKEQKMFHLEQFFDNWFSHHQFEELPVGSVTIERLAKKLKILIFP